MAPLIGALVATRKLRDSKNMYSSAEHVRCHKGPAGTHFSEEIFRSILGTQKRH